MIKTHQEAGAQWLIAGFNQQLAGRCLGWETGVGKTLSVMRFLELASPRRALILCPAIARQEWKRQAELFYPGKFDLRLCSESKEIDKSLATDEAGI